MKERPLMRRFEERRRVGENLWALLEEIELGPRGISKARVLQAAIGADPIDSTKHLARYAIRPSDDPEVAQRRGRFLLKTAGKFVRIARVAADLGGLDPDSAVLRILDGTVYTQDAPESAVDDHMAQRADNLAAMLADIAGRLCWKHRVGAGMRRMEEAGWGLCAPGDLSSPMQGHPALIGKPLVPPATAPRRLAPPPPVAQNLTAFQIARATHRAPVDPPSVMQPDPALIGSQLVAPPPPFPRNLPWAQIERYPHVHLGYVSGELSQRRMFGRVVGKFQFDDAEGDRFETELGVFDVCCWPVFRIDLVLAPTSYGSASTLMWALSYVTWVKPIERLSWTTPSGAEYWIDQNEALGEIATFVSPREATGLIDPDHGIPLEASHFAWPGGFGNGSLMLLTDEEGRVTNDFRPPVPGRQASLDAIEVCYPPSQRDVAFVTRTPLLSICDQPVLHRHFGPDPRIAHLWTDERPTGTSYADHPLAEDPVPAAPALDPVEAPEGSLSARLERWLQGTLANRGTFEEDLEAAVVAFMARIEATTGAARERLAAAVYGKR